jgi:formamidopyrimidine-DNA glycosylase
LQSVVTGGSVAPVFGACRESLSAFRPAPFAGGSAPARAVRYRRRMPELPDITLYVEHLERRIAGATLVRVRVVSPSLLMTVDPPLEALAGRRVTGVQRLGKRIVLALEGDLFLVLHLMVAGRLQWKDAGAPVPARVGLAAFEFTTGTLVLTEASTRRRATLHVVAGRRALARLDPGGLEPLAVDTAAFAERLRSEDHTLKRSLTDPRLFSGIGNAYSDEILHRAQLSPLQHSVNLDDAEVARLHDAVRRVLSEWTERLRRDAGDAFPTRVTAFRKDMAVHGRYRQPCPVCGSPVQRIVYAENETNYCARCQTGGRLLADRALSRLLRKDWPRTLEEMEA